MARVAARFDPSVVAGSALTAVVADAAAIEKMAGSVKAVAAARLAETGRWRAAGDRSAAHHLARTTGTSVAQAAEAIETARRLDRSPATEQALRRGDLSLQQAAAIVSAAEADPSAEAGLVQSAGRLSLTELRQDCARVRAAGASDLEAQRSQAHRNRRLRSYPDGEGGWNLRARGTPEAGATVMAALGPLTDRLFRRARAEGRREPVEAYAFDALVELARATFEPLAGPECPCPDHDDLCCGDGRPSGAVGEARGGGARGAVADADHSALAPDQGVLAMVTETVGDDSGGDADDDAGADDAPATGPPRRGRAPAVTRRRLPAKIIVRIDLGAWLRGYPVSGEVCELVGFGPVAVSAVRDLVATGDPFLAAVVTKGVEVAGVAHLGRQATAHQRTALEWLYPTCAVEGCAAQAHLEIDHRRDWAKSGFTVLDLLDRLCTLHHDLKTREGWALVEGVGRRAFVAPGDPRHPRQARRGAAAGRSP